MNNARSIIRGWIGRSEKPHNKYNEGLRQAVGEWSGEVPADSRGGEDTGMEMESLIEEDNK
jgi:hypothetical protein